MKSFSHKIYAFQKSNILSSLTSLQSKLESNNNLIYKIQVNDGNTYTKVRSKLSNEDLFTIRRENSDIIYQIEQYNDQLRCLENEKQSYIFQ